MFRIIGKTIFIVVGVFFLFSTPAQGGDRPLMISSGKKFQYAETKRFPADVRLTPQFNPRKICQSGGTCHIHTAVNLLEAACYRATGKRLDLSEAYYYYRHIRPQLEKGYAIDKKVEPYLATHKDGGRVERTVERFRNGSVCLENDFKCTTADFVNWTRLNGEHFTEFLELKVESDGEQAYLKALPGFKKISEKIVKVRSSSKLRATYPGDFQREMDVMAGRALNQPSMYESKEGYVKKSENPAVKACIAAGINYKAVPYSEEKMISLLARGIPVGCSGFVGYEGDEKPVDYSARHVFTINGYRYDEETNQMRFAHRDSNDLPLRKMDCEELVVVYTDAENPYPKN